MATTPTVDQNLANIITEIIQKYKLDPKSKINYDMGSNDGEGYLSRSLSVSITDEEKDTLNLFIKSALDISDDGLMPLKSLYANEIHFYETIYPAFFKFLNEKGVLAFENVPKCFATTPENVIALENLAKEGYVLLGDGKFMSNNEIELALRTIARYHAICFAFKDQRYEEYLKLTEPVKDTSVPLSNQNFVIQRKSFTYNFLSNLDPVKDEYMIRKVEDLIHSPNYGVYDTFSANSEYSILIQGDFWNNNIMFLYDDQTKRPINIKLVDWQMMRPALPVHDLSLFFYNVASKDALNRLKYFLKVYHDELAENIRQLGSNPDLLYPYSILEKHWKEYGKHGFVLALINSLLVLVEKDENFFSFEDVDLNNPESWASLYKKIRKHDEYVERLKAIADHMIINNFF
ncbi:hypothetical protein MML48_2g00014039 [Holotrichia oblita]|uniref:Uncharacterized protein n=1 Tax=Holotrichia oblita TaxID=644536 RepID=A0ACB9TKX3_HOLOL|nr:hypothetical protein MML48_2g00014039 [Holotrichia oblita]